MRGRYGRRKVPLSPSSAVINDSSSPTLNLVVPVNRRDRIACSYFSQMSCGRSNKYAQPETREHCSGHQKPAVAAAAVQGLGVFLVCHIILLFTLRGEKKKTDPEVVELARTHYRCNLQGYLHLLGRFRFADAGIQDSVSDAAPFPARDQVQATASSHASCGRMHQNASSAFFCHAICQKRTLSIATPIRTATESRGVVLSFTSAHMVRHEGFLAMARGYRIPARRIGEWHEEVEPGVMSRLPPMQSDGYTTTSACLP